MKHKDKVCSDAGIKAEELNKQGNIQFDRTTTGFWLRASAPRLGEAATGASVPPIYLGPASFEDAKGNVVVNERRNTIAHEVTHIVDPASGLPSKDVPGGPAYKIGDKCAID